MASLTSLQIRCYIMPNNVFTSFLFEPHSLVSDVCQAIRALPGSAQGHFHQFGLFKQHEEYHKCEWLEMDKTLEHYNIKSGDMLFYRNKIRPLRVRTLENFVKIVQVDDSRSVEEVTKAVCSKFGLPNYLEYSLTLEQDGVSHSKDKIGKLRKKYRIGEALNWLAVDKSLREQGITEATEVTLRKKFFFSDTSVHTNDSAQLSLIYAQSRDAIVSGTHPCTRKEAILLAALQCHIQYGAYKKSKHVPGSLNLSELLPVDYSLAQDMDIAILRQYSSLETLKPLEAMYGYVHLCQSLPTYGMTFFPVKRKMKGKFKSPQDGLLGVKKDAIVFLDADNKDVSCSWSIETVKGWGFNKHIFSMITSESSCSTDDKQYFYTTEGEAIENLISGYVQLTLKMAPVYEVIPDSAQKPASPTSMPEEPKTEGYVELTSPMAKTEGYVELTSLVAKDVRSKGQTELGGSAGASDSKKKAENEEGYIEMQRCLRSKNHKQVVPGATAPDVTHTNVGVNLYQDMDALRQKLHDANFDFQDNKMDVFKMIPHLPPGLQLDTEGVQGATVHLQKPENIITNPLIGTSTLQNPIRVAPLETDLNPAIMVHLGVDSLNPASMVPHGTDSVTPCPDGMVTLGINSQKPASMVPQGMDTSLLVPDSTIPFGTDTSLLVSDSTIPFGIDSSHQTPDSLAFNNPEYMTPCSAISSLQNSAIDLSYTTAAYPQDLAMGIQSSASPETGINKAASSIQNTEHAVPQNASVSVLNPTADNQDVLNPTADNQDVLNPTADNQDVALQIASFLQNNNLSHLNSVMLLKNTTTGLQTLIVTPLNATMEELDSLHSTNPQIASKNPFIPQKKMSLPSIPTYSQQCSTSSLPHNLRPSYTNPSKAREKHFSATEFKSDNSYPFENVPSTYLLQPVAKDPQPLLLSPCQPPILPLPLSSSTSEIPSSSPPPLPPRSPWAFPSPPKLPPKPSQFSSSSDPHFYQLPAAEVLDSQLPEHN